MRLKSALFALSLSLVVLLPRLSFADTLTLTGVGGQSTDGVYVYPYDFTVTGPGGTSTNIEMSCLNYNRDISFGETWTVDMVSVSSIGTAGLDGESKQDYIEDAWLYNQYATATTPQEISDIQFAIWAVMDPSVFGVSGYDSAAFALDKEAYDAYKSGNFSFDANDSVFVPVAGGWPQGDGEPQIFMIDPAPPAVTPEPSSLFLFGTGLLSIVAVMRRKMQTAQQAAKV